MCYKTMGRSTIFNGRIHYFDWAIFNSYVTNYQRVYPRRIVDQSILVYSMLMMQYWQYHCWLVVWSLDHEFYDFPSGWECHHPNWRSHIFHRGRYIYHQPVNYEPKNMKFWTWQSPLMSLHWKGNTGANIGQQSGLEMLITNGTSRDFLGSVISGWILFELCSGCWVILPLRKDPYMPPQLGWCFWGWLYLFCKRWC